MLKKKQEHTVKSQRKVPQSHLAKSTMAAPSVTWLLLPAVVLPPALKASELWPSTSYWDWMAGKDGNGYTYILYIYI
jgi:hypothetical protein